MGMGMYSHRADKVEPSQWREAAGEGKERPWVLLETAADPRTCIFQPTPMGLITANFLPGDGKVKIMFQSRLSTSLGL